MRTPRDIGRSLVVGLIVGTLAAACTGLPPSTAPVSSQPASPAATGAAPNHLEHATPIVVIFMENHEAGDVSGSTSAPYETVLARRGRSYTNYFAIAHPSLPNYLAFASGSTQGKTTDDISAGEIAGPSLWSQLTGAGIRWAVYEESMPSACFKGVSAGSSPGDYALKHDPAIPFGSVASSGSQCARVQPFSEMDPTHLPPVSFITPNECSDAHSCDLSAGDQWLADRVPPLLRAGADVIVTYDEGTTDLGVNGAGGGHVFAVEVGPGFPAGVEVTRPMNHYSLLAGLEQRFRLPRLGAAADVAPLPI